MGSVHVMVVVGGCCNVTMLLWDLNHALSLFFIPLDDTFGCMNELLFIDRQKVSKQYIHSQWLMAN